MSNTANRRPPAPTPFEIGAALRAVHEARERLLAIDPDMPETDRECYLDTLDGSSGDAFAILDRIIRAHLDTLALEKAAEEHAKRLKERAGRFARRADNLRNVAQAMLEAIGVRRIERADYTAFLRQNQPHVVITDETALAPRYQRVKTIVEPDKAAIAAALKAGETVEGAALSNPAQTLQVRL